MKPTYLNCIEFNGGNALKPQKSEPALVDNQAEVKVYKMNLDGSTGELLRIEPAFPEGWEKRKILPGLPGNQSKKEDDTMYPPRKDREELMATAKKMKQDGISTPKAAAILKVPASTLTTWLKKEERMQKKKANLEQQEEPNIENIDDFTAAKDATTPDQTTEQETGQKNLHEQLETLKLDFANLTLKSDLTNVVKLKVIEHIIRM